MASLLEDEPNMVIIVMADTRTPAQKTIYFLFSLFSSGQLGIPANFLTS